MQEAEREISGAIEKVLEHLDIKVSDHLNFSLERSPEPQFGDFASNVVLVSWKEAKRANLAKTLQEWGQYVKEKLEEDQALIKIIEKMEIAGAGFLNFYLHSEIKVQQLADILEKEELETVNLGEGKKVLVEFSSPNIAKPFTIGHLRSTIIGAAIANLLTISGYEVKRDNHIGDWGTQFGKQLVALERWGDLEDIKKDADPIKKLVDLYVRFHEEAEKDETLNDEARRVFFELENGDEKYLSMWQNIIDISMKEFDSIYKKLCVQFTENDGKGYGESFAVNLSEEVVKELKSKGLLKESRGAQIVEFAPEKKLPPLIIIKQDGTSIYATRDLAIDKFRLDQYGPDIKIINEVGKEQSLYFKQLFETERMLNWFQAGQRVHIAHGLYRFKDRKMSTRKGEVIWLKDVIKTAEERVKELNEDINEKNAEIIAIGAIKWNDLSREAINDIDFNLDEMLNLKGNSGAYMQYSVVRLRSLEKKSENEVFDEVALWKWWGKEKKEEFLNKIGLKMENWSEDEKGLLNELLKFEMAVKMATTNLAPHVLTGYLYSLAQKFNYFYNGEKVGGNLRRLSLARVTEMILTAGLDILGIQIPDKM